MEDEIHEYLNGTIEIAEGVQYSEHRLKRRIALFENRTYPTGKTDKQGRYKYWSDIIGPRRDSEVKNLRVDTKHFMAFSDTPIKDFAAVFIANASIKQWMWESGQAEELQSDVEKFSGHGNVLFKKAKGGYETCDSINTYIINQAAKTVDDTPIIHRHQLTQSQLREKAANGTYENVEEVIRNCGDRKFAATERTAEKTTTSPLYEIFERNGEVTEAELFEAQGKEGGAEDKQVMARIVVAGLKKGAKDHKYTLYADTLKGTMSKHYKEAHRGPYKGKWWREGMYELLFDHQVRANEIAVQLAKGLEWASKVVFRSTESIAANNIVTDIMNGTIIKSTDLSQVNVRMEGFDQLIADWNRVLSDADRIANSFEIVSGEALPSGTPFALANRLDQNANKLFVFLRQKLTVQYKQVFRDWMLPQLLGALKTKDIIRLTGDSEMVEQLRKLQAENWFSRNLVALGPNVAIPGVKEALIEKKIQELMAQEPIIKNDPKLWKDILSRIHITITGENMDLSEQLSTLGNLLQLEQDPVRRAFLLDRVYALKGIPIPPPPQPAPMPATAMSAPPANPDPALTPQPI